MHTAPSPTHPLDDQELRPVDADTIAEYRRSGGSLTTITGYLVVQTIADGVYLTQGDDPHVDVVASLAGSSRYGQALDIAHTYRGPGSWALVYSVHADGLHSGHGYELSPRFA